jgi:hypothetical protein
MSYDVEECEELPVTLQEDPAMNLYQVRYAGKKDFVTVSFEEYERLWQALHDRVTRRSPPFDILDLL